MGSNQLCGVNYHGQGTYTTEGITKLCEALKESSVTSLKCATTPVFAFVLAPTDTPPSLGSLAQNELCGIGFDGFGTYTAKCITRLCECLMGSAVTSLKCAATPQSVCFCVSAH